MAVPALLGALAIVALQLHGCQPATTAAPTCASLAPWSFFGGDWSSDGQVLEALRNGRGDMAISRRSYGDVRFSVEMQLRDLYLGTNYGDAGVLFRVRNPHLGVDSYNGYYLGLRGSDHSLFFGRVEGEWQPLLSRQLPLPLQVGAWYRLAVEAQGCRFLLSASPLPTGAATAFAYTDPDCIPSGSLGLRVYYVQAAWRNLQVQGR